MMIQHSTKSLFNKIIECYIMSEYNINAKSLFNRITKISYINEIQYLAKSLLQDYKISYNEKLLKYYKKIFFRPPHILQKKFLMPHFQHTIFFCNILM